MKILLVHNSYKQPGGEDTVFLQEKLLLERAGHTVVTYCRSNWEVDSYSGLKKLDLARNSIWSNDTRRVLAQLLDKEKPALAHIHNTFVMMSPSIYSACTDAGVPVVQTLHNYRLFCPGATFFRDGHVCEDCVEHSLWRSVRHGCYRNSRATTALSALIVTIHRQRETWFPAVNRYIALSEFSRGRFIRAGLPREKIMVKPNFVYPDPGLRANGDAGEYALFVGRLSPEKRVSTVLAACRRLGDRIPLVVIGGGPELNLLKEEVVHLGLSKVCFYGQLSREQTLAAMRKARFLVFSSEWYENFPVTIAESFASGVPVISSRLGAMKEIIQDGRTGLHFMPGDSEHLAEKVDWAWNHASQMQDMGREARREYESKYTADKNYPILMDIYRQALKHEGPVYAANTEYEPHSSTINLTE
jgi:glycosyltransferase involved in cell wall biosynthesis